MTLFHLAEYILQTHAVQATSYTKARTKQLWKLIVGDKDPIADIDVSQPSAVYVSGAFHFDLTIRKGDRGPVLAVTGQPWAGIGPKPIIEFASLDELQTAINRPDHSMSYRQLITKLDLARVARPNGEPTGRLPREACTPP